LCNAEGNYQPIQKEQKFNLYSPFLQLHLLEVKGATGSEFSEGDWVMVSNLIKEEHLAFQISAGVAATLANSPLSSP
jgi:hypothetical protein